MNLYLLFKSFHLVAVISWMAGLLYLPRIFVYHSDTKEQSQSETFKTMERRLFNYIMTPSMILSWIFGVLLIHSIGFSIFSETWMQAKGILVLLLTHYHFYLGKCVRNFSFNRNVNSSKFYRIINEIPTVFLIIIIFLVVFKPL